MFGFIGFRHRHPTLGFGAVQKNSSQLRNFPCFVFFRLVFFCQLLFYASVFLLFLMFNCFLFFFFLFLWYSFVFFVCSSWQRSLFWCYRLLFLFSSCSRLLSSIKLQKMKQLGAVEKKISNWGGGRGRDFAGAECRVTPEAA